MKELPPLETMNRLAKLYLDAKPFDLIVEDDQGKFRISVQMEAFTRSHWCGSEADLSKANGQHVNGGTIELLVRCAWDE